MSQLTEKQKQRLEKLAKVLDGGEIAIVQQIAEVEDRLDEVASQIPALRQAVDGVDGKPGYTPIKGKDYFDGEDGNDYVLTEKDKQEIAKSITVPVVEKVIEKTETIIKEVPIVTNEIIKEIKTVEVAVLDDATVGYLEEEIKKLEKKHGGYGQVVRELRAGTNVTIDNSNLEYPVINATGGGGGAWGAITGTLADQTDLQTALDNKLDDTQFSGLSKITVGTSAPVAPATNDLWIDTN